MPGTCIRLIFSFWYWSYLILQCKLNQFQSSVTFLCCAANQVTGFCMKDNTVLKRVKLTLKTWFGSRYSRMDHAKFVEDSLYKNCSDMVHFNFFKGCLRQILLGPLLDTLTRLKIDMFIPTLPTPFWPNQKLWWSILVCMVNTLIIITGIC